MAMNRVQFQRGLSMADFFNRYGSEAQCEAELETLRWPDGLLPVPIMRSNSGNTHTATLPNSNTDSIAGSTYALSSRDSQPPLSPLRPELSGCCGLAEVRR